MIIVQVLIKMRLIQSQQCTYIDDYDSTLDKDEIDKDPTVVEDYDSTLDKDEIDNDPTV